MSRSIHMGYSYSAYFIITQLKQDQEHFEGLYADLPANRKFEVLPGEEISIQLHGLSAGTSYDVYQYYSENDIDIFDTFFSNTGGDYLYTSAFPEGDFGFSFSNSQFNVSYPEAYRNHYSFDTRALAFPAEGDVMRVYFDSYSKWNGMKSTVLPICRFSIEWCRITIRARSHLGIPVCDCLTGTIRNFDKPTSKSLVLRI